MAHSVGTAIDGECFAALKETVRCIPGFGSATM